MKNADAQKISLIGFGEAAMNFVKGWSVACTTNINAYDIKTNDPSEAVRQKKYGEYDHSAVKGCHSLKEALTDAEVIFSLVTADQALIVAQAAASHISDGVLFLDGNSCAPDTKRQAENIITAAGGRYVDMAVMAPVQVDLSKVPLLLSGPHADTALVVVEKLQMTARVMSPHVGDASSVKMMRSIMIKGMEALMMECLLSARKAGVDEMVLSSLESSFSKERATYMMERVTKHGLRRAAEMQEVALTIDQLGLDGKMARATADWQQLIGELEISDLDEENYQNLADRILARLDEKENIKNGSGERLTG